MTIKDKIFKFIKQNQYNKASELILSNKSFNVNIYNENNISLIELVINSNNFTFINLLINKGINLDILDIEERQYYINLLNIIILNY